MTTKRRHPLAPQLWRINANWTSLAPREGWRHFRIAGRRRDPNGQVQVEMMAVCDRQIRFWIEADELKDSERWIPGWHDQEA